MPHAIRASLVAALLFALAGAAAATPPLPAVSPDTALFARIDLDRLEKSPLFPDLLALLRAAPGGPAALSGLETHLGLDLARDVSAISLAAAGAEQGVIYLEGPLGDARKRLPGVKALKRKKHAGGEYFSDGSRALAFAGERLVLGREAAVKTALGAKAEGLPPALAPLAEQVDRTGDLWFVTVVPEALRERLGKRLGAVRTLSGSLDVAEGLTLNAEATVEDGSAAQQMAENAAKALAEAGRRPMLLMMGLGALLQKVSITADGPRVRLVAKLDAAEVQRLRGLLGLVNAARGTARPPAAPPAPPPPPAPAPAP